VLDVSLVDEVLQVTNDESIAAARQLPLEEGLFVASRPVQPCRQR